MTYLHQALYKFWAQLGLPVYLQGRAPDNAVFPYVTINIIAPDTFRDASLTAFVWLKDDGNNANALRASYLDAASRLIPAEGVLLELPTGLVQLMRHPTDFLSYYDDPEIGSNVIGGRIAYTLRQFSR